MREIIKDQAIVQDDWTVLRLAEGETPDAIEVPAGKHIIPLQVWLIQREELVADEIKELIDEADSRKVMKSVLNDFEPLLSLPESTNGHATVTNGNGHSNGKGSTTPRIIDSTLNSERNNFQVSPESKDIARFMEEDKPY